LNVCPQEGDDLVSLDVGHLAEGSHYPEDQNPDRVIAVLHRLGGPYRAHKKL
jgi:hypothetical protein